MIRQFDSLLQMMNAFPDEQSCVDHFRAIRWKDGAFCPYCGGIKVYHFKDGRTHKCGNRECGKRFSIRVGTIFEDSKLPLRTWFVAIFLITSHKKGIASTQLAKDLGITQKSAWFVLHRLRHAARTKSFNRPLEGTVEVDETYVGGKEKNKHAHKRTGDTRGGKGKIAVVGTLERNGELRARKVERVDGKILKREVERNVKPGTTVMTDEHRGYISLDGPFNHYAVNHSAGEYVRWFFLHINGLEGAWSHFKRQIVGVHHFISPDHLPRYLDEFVWRWNRREMGEGQRVNSLLDQVAGRLTYKELTA